MTRPIVIRPPQSLSINKRQPLLSGQDSCASSRCGVRKARFAEVAGGTTAECAAVACCCPCGIANLLVLAVYKVPAGLCRKALRKKRQNRKKALLPGKTCGCDHEMELIHSCHVSNPVAVVGGGAGALENDKEAVELEKEMWDKFYGAGFWRSPSQRTDIEM